MWILAVLLNRYLYNKICYGTEKSACVLLRVETVCLQIRNMYDKDIEK